MHDTETLRIHDKQSNSTASDNLTQHPWSWICRTNNREIDSAHMVCYTPVSPSYTDSIWHVLSHTDKYDLPRKGWGLMSFSVSVINGTRPGKLFITASNFPKSTCIIAHYRMRVDIMRTTVFHHHEASVSQIEREILQQKYIERLPDLLGILWRIQLNENSYLRQWYIQICFISFLLVKIKNFRDINGAIC